MIWLWVFLSVFAVTGAMCGLTAHDMRKRNLRADDHGLLYYMLMGAILGPIVLPISLLGYVYCYVTQ